MNLKNLTIYLLFAFVLFGLTECVSGDEKEKGAKRKGKKTRTQNSKRKVSDGSGLSGQASGTGFTGRTLTNIDAKEVQQFINDFKAQKNIDPQGMNPQEVQQFINSYQEMNIDPTLLEQVIDSFHQTKQKITPEILKRVMKATRKGKESKAQKPRRKVSDGSGVSGQSDTGSTERTITNIDAQEMNPEVEQFINSYHVQQLNIDHKVLRQVINSFYQNKQIITPQILQRVLDSLQQTKEILDLQEIMAKKKIKETRNSLNEKSGRNIDFGGPSAQHPFTDGMTHYINQQIPQQRHNYPPIFQNISNDVEDFYDKETASGSGTQ